MSNYSNLNVFSSDFIKRLQTEEESITQVQALIDTTGNRKRRRAAIKVLNNTMRVQEKCQQSANERASKQLQRKADQSFIWLYGAVALTLYEDYHWKEDPNQDHGQITSFMERLSKRMQKMVDKGYSTEDVINRVEELTGISLQLGD